MATEEKPGADPSERAAMMTLYKGLLRVRRAEERVQALISNGEIPGFIHLSIGQEAISVGVMSALRADDTIASTHRGHGHAIAKGLPLAGFFAELLGKDTGLCRGRGGSMHVADMRVGMLGANGIVGAGIPIALGSALAHRTRKVDNVAVTFFGDGALAEGVLHESMNLAGLWRLPVLFVCEANGWSEFSPASSQIAFDRRRWAESFGIVYSKVGGNDVLAVATAAGSLVDAQRRGGPAAFLECATHRVRGHYEGDSQKYRPAGESAAQDPIAVAAARLDVSEEWMASTATRVDEEVDTAVAVAREGKLPSFNAAMQDVYTLGSK
jgi:pyruvate dehydrogenase E1 component alpha subunit